MTGKFRKRVVFGVGCMFLLSALTITNVLGQEKVILTVWDQFGISGFSAGGPATEELHKIFEEKYPDIKVVRSYFSTWGIRPTLKAALAAGDQPEIAYTFPSAAYLGLRAKTGVLADLTQTAIDHGWFDIWPDSMTKRCMYKGKLYAIPHEMDYMGVFYNKEIFAKLGLLVPQTYDEFLELCQKIKDAGITPLAFGNREEVGHARHQITLFTNLQMGREEFEDVLFGDGRWDGPKWVKAWEMFRGIVERGFYNEGFSGLGYLEANSMFLHGMTAMEITGTWFLESFIDSPISDKLGVFLLPPLTRGDAPALLIGDGSDYQVFAQTPKKFDAAVKYLDFMISDEAAPIWIEKGGVVPIRKRGLIDWEDLDVVEITRAYYQLGDRHQATGIWDFYTNFTPALDLEVFGKVPLVLEGVMSPQEFTSDFQAKWEAEKRADRLWTPGELPAY